MAGKKILLIDDEVDLLNLVRMRLESAGYEVIYLNSGKDAFGFVKEKKPDLILLDIMLPDKNGYDICLEIKQDPQTSSIPVVIFTAKPQWQKDIKALGEFVKADDYIFKPFEARDLLARIKHLLGG